MIEKEQRISTHTPLARRDSFLRRFAPTVQFLLTRLLRGVTARGKSPLN